MEQILLCTNHLPPVTTIYNSFIQNEMLDANGSYVKVYLYLNMCIQSGNTVFSISSLADQMYNTEKEIIRALHYWEKKKLILLNRNNEDVITGIEFLVPEQHETVHAENSQAEHGQDISESEREQTPEQDSTNHPENSESAAARPKPSSKETSSRDVIHITEDQILRLNDNNDFKWIINIVQSFLKRPISSAETNLLMYLYDNLQFSRDLILYLYEYCCTLGKTNVKYVQTVALSWADQNVSTPEQAKAASTAYNATYTSIIKAFGLNRALGAAEIKYADRWSREWNFELPIILEACNRTILNTQKADFKYADSILSNWQKNGVRTLQDISALDDAFSKKKNPKPSQHPHQAQDPKASASKNQFQSFQQRNISEEDMALLEKTLLAK